MQVRTALRASGNTHPGLLRDINEDRFHFDPARGIFIVIDGVGGQAAGEKAAEAALAKIRARLENGAGTAEDRIRAAILSANEEILRLASIRPDWKGMACVLTIALVEDGEVIVGHVGDTRLYRIRRGRIEKLTRDHSPIGEREDAGEISEADAMRHPRRNEVYRDVGSEPHGDKDPGFIDVFRSPFEADAALLLCSDGLTDQVDSVTIRKTVEEYAGHPYEIVRTLIDAANDAGGKDNVTVVYVEGSKFAEGEETGAVARRLAAEPAHAGRAEWREPATAERPSGQGQRARWRVAALVVLLFAVIVWAAYARWDLFSLPAAPLPVAPEPVAAVITVEAGQSIAAAIARAGEGSEIVVGPGEYRERLQLKNGIRVRSRVAGGAAIRLPGGASESDAAIVATDVGEAEVAGFRVVGDAATPLGTGVFAANSRLTLTDMEISGAQVAAVVFGNGAAGAVLASRIHDNPGAAIAVRSGARARIAHNTFEKNAVSERAPGWILVEAGAQAEIAGNNFLGIRPEAVLTPSGGGVSTLRSGNWFTPPPARAPARSARPGRR